MSYQLDDGLSSAEDLTRFSRHCTKWYRDGWRNECMFRSRTSVPRLDCCSRESHDVVCPFKVFLLSYPGSRAVWIWGWGWDTMVRPFRRHSAGFNLPKLMDQWAGCFWAKVSPTFGLVSQDSNAPVFALLLNVYTFCNAAKIPFQLTSK
jgi:hypothetical protein